VLEGFHGGTSAVAELALRVDGGRDTEHVQAGLDIGHCRAGIAKPQGD
jgi:hypothetical protein